MQKVTLNHIILAKHPLHFWSHISFHSFFFSFPCFVSEWNFLQVYWVYFLALLHFIEKKQTIEWSCCVSLRALNWWIFDMCASLSSSSFVLSLFSQVSTSIMIAQHACGEIKFKFQSFSQLPFQKDDVEWMKMKIKRRLNHKRWDLLIIPQANNIIPYLSLHNICCCKNSWWIGMKKF